MIAQRRTASLRDKSGLNALSVYAQLCVGFSLYLYGQVSTPGYLSALLTAPLLLLFFLPARFLARRKKPGISVTVSAAGANGSKIFFLCFSLLHLLDAQLAFFTLCAVVRDVMPDFERTAVALASALFCALGGGEDEGLSRLSRPLKWLIGALLLYCVVIAVPHGRAAHFFPLLGYGPASILGGTLWISGAVASAVWPLLTREDTEPPRRFFLTLRAPLLALALGIVTYLASVWLMPVYVMQRPESLGWRMLLLVHMTPSVPAWSMEVIPGRQGAFSIWRKAKNAAVSHRRAAVSAGSRLHHGPGRRAGNADRRRALAGRRFPSAFDFALLMQPDPERKESGRG